MIISENKILVIKKKKKKKRMGGTQEGEIETTSLQLSDLLKNLATLFPEVQYPIVQRDDGKYFYLKLKQ